MENSTLVSRKVSPMCMKRLMRDVLSFNRDPPQNIFIDQDDNDMTNVHALIIGPSRTPYEGGFFLFLLKFPDNYPNSPPSVKNLTTDGGTVKFGPNLYESGKVCVSILNTEGNHCWSPVQTLSSILISIQSLLSEYPFSNKRGFKAEDYPEESEKYNAAVNHEVLRVAVCGMTENDTHITIPKSLDIIIKNKFLKLYNIYENNVKKNMNLDGEPFFNSGAHYVRENGIFFHAKLLRRMKDLREKISAEATELSPPVSKIGKFPPENEDFNDFYVDAHGEDESD